MSIEVRKSTRAELPEVNKLRKNVNDIHVNGRPDVFRAGFCDELSCHVYEKYDAENSEVLVALKDYMVCGYAIVEYIERPQTAYNNAQKFYHIEEFGVKEECRRQGIGTALVSFMKADALKRGFKKIELDMWEFNESALDFYEKTGFRTYRRHMDMDI